VQGFSVWTFLSSLAATLSGSAVAAVVALSILRRQRQDKYHETLLAALRSSIAAIMRFSSASVYDEREEERVRLLADAELKLLMASTKGKDQLLAHLIATEFWYLSDRQNAARSRTTAELGDQLAAMANRPIPRDMIAEAVHETARGFRAHGPAADRPHPSSSSPPA
jgi:hypothetical protein